MLDQSAPELCVFEGCGMSAFVRDINKIVVHCSATEPSMDIGAFEIDLWHRKRGWDMIGYHAVIRRDGTLERGRKPRHIGAHAKGHNKDSLGVCLVGGVDEDGQPENNFTVEQFNTLREWIDEVCDWYGDLTVVGHRDLQGAKTNCPCFDAGEWF